MNNQNQINIEIPQSVIDGVMQKLQECKKELAPYLARLESDKNISFFKIENKSIAKINEITKLDSSEDSEFIISFRTKDKSLVSQANPINNLASFFRNLKEVSQ